MILGECALQMCLHASRFTFYEVATLDLTGKKCQPNSESSQDMLGNIGTGINQAAAVADLKMQVWAGGKTCVPHRTDDLPSDD